MPGRMQLQDATPPWVRSELAQRGYPLECRARTAGPISAILVDPECGTLWGGSSDDGRTTASSGEGL